MSSNPKNEKEKKDSLTEYFRLVEMVSSVLFIVSIVISGVFLGATQCFANTCEGCPVYCTSSDASYVVAWTNLVTSVIVLFNLCLK